MCALDSEVFDGVVGVAQSGGVDEAECVVSDGESVFDGVACGAVDVGHDGALLAEDEVEQR